MIRVRERVRSVLGAGALAAVALCCATPAAAQLPSCSFRGAPDALAERPSPLDSLMIELGGAPAKLCYGRPSLRGRTMIGVVEPYGTPWRMGANEPTTLHLGFRARLGPVDLAPGSYSLYAIPQASDWTIVVNSDTRRWGIPISPDVRRSDVGSFEVATRSSDTLVETLTFSFEGGGNAGDLVLAWERTTLRIPIRHR